MKTQLYRKVKTSRQGVWQNIPAYLLDKYGNRYDFRLFTDDVTKASCYILDTLPEFKKGSSLLYGDTVQEIVDALNLSEAVIIKDWN